MKGQMVNEHEIVGDFMHQIVIKINKVIIPYSIRIGVDDLKGLFQPKWIYKDACGSASSCFHPWIPVDVLFMFKSSRARFAPVG